MAIIYSYPITTPQDSDLFIISRVPDDPDEISNFSVGVGTIAEYIIDKLIDPNAFDFQIPVFNQSGNRITGSIMSQDSSPSNGVAGTKITIAGNLEVNGTAQIDSLTSGFLPYNNPQGILADSVIYQDADGHVGINVQPDPEHVLEVFDDRTGDPSGQHSIYLTTYASATPGSGAGGILARVSGDSGATFNSIAMVPGTSSSDWMTSNQTSFYANSNLDTSSATGYSGKITHDGANAHWILGGAFGDTTTATLKVVGTSEFTDQLTIPLTPVANTDAASKGYVDSQLDKDLQIEGDTGTGSINLDTQVFDVAGGTYIDTAAGGQTITVDISAVDGNPGVNERYLTKNNTWAEIATIPGTYTFNINADTGTAQTVNTTETLLLAGGTYINTSVGTGPEVTFNHDNTTLTTTSSSLSPGSGGSFSVIDSITTNLQGHVTNINTLTVTLPQDTDNYVDGGSYSSATGILTLSRTGGLANVTASGFLQLGATSSTALAGDTITITQTQADDITANNLKVSFPEAPTDGQQYARQNSGWSVVSGGGGGGVTGAGTTNTLPIWTDGPNSVLSNSPITTIYDLGGNPKEVDITTTSGFGGKWNFNGAGGKFVMTTENVPDPDVFLFSSDSTGFYRRNFQYRGTLALGRSSQATGATLDVGTSADTIPAAWFRNGVVISNNPSGVQVDNTSMVIGAGNNDNVSGSDHCLIVGSGNQITSNSDRSVAFGQSNALTSSIDAFAVGNSNTLTSSLRTQALGFNNTITASSSFIAGGGNSITATSNIFALGDNHTVTGTTQDAYLLGTANTITGGTGSFAIGSNLDGDTGNHMVVGYRNDKTSYPVTDYSLGLGNTKFALAVGSTTTTNSNALLITEGGVNRGGGVAQVPRVLLPTVTGFSASNDAAADALGVPQGALYQNQGVVQINRGGGSTTDPLSGGGGNYTIDVINSNTVGQKNYLYVLIGGSAITLTMPSSPSSGDSIKVVNLTTVTTCVIAQGGSPIMGVGQDMILNNNKANFELVYTDVTYGWVVIGATGEI